MGDGIRIENASLAIGREALEALLRREGCSLVLERLEAVVPADALNALLAARPAERPEGAAPAPPAVEPFAGGVRLRFERDGRAWSVEVRAEAVRLAFAEGEMRLVTESEP